MSPVVGSRGNGPGCQSQLSWPSLFRQNSIHMLLGEHRSHSSGCPEGYSRVKTLVRGFLIILWDNRRIMDTSSLDFVYLESDPETQQPSACIYLKARSKQDYAGVKADRLISAPCLSFIELDAE